MSRSNDEKEDRPTAPEIFFVGGRLKRDSVSAGGFEVFIFTTLGLWITALFIFFKVGFEIKLEDPDLGIIASISATLAGLALAFLTLIYQLNLRDRFLKISFGFLTFVLFVSTILVVVAVMTYDRNYTATPRVSILFISSMVFLAPLLGRRFTKKHWSKIEHVAYLLPFLVPVPLIVAISDRKLLTASVLLLLLGVIGLPVLMVVFIYGTLRRQPEETAEEKFFSASVVRWQKRLDEEKHFEDLKDKILNILREKRVEQLDAYNNSRLDTEEFLVTTEELDGNLALSNESGVLINRALDELADTKQIYSGHRSASGYLPHTQHHYLAPEPEIIDEALKNFRKYSVIALRSKEGSGVKLDNLRLAKELAKKFQYPRTVVAKFLLVPLVSVLKEEYLTNKTQSRTGDWEVYVKRDSKAAKKALAIWSAWGFCTIELAEKTGMPMSGHGIKPSYDSVKWHLQERSWTIPLWQVLVNKSPNLRRLLSDEILPENFDTGLNNSIDLYEFFDELTYLLPRLREEVGEAAT